MLCRAEPPDGPPSTAGARPAPNRPLRLKGLLLLGSWGLQRGRAPSGAPGLAVQLGRGPHGQCPGRARPSCTARPQLLAMSCWWPMTFSSMLLLQRQQREGVPAPAWALAARGTVGMVGMRHHAGLWLHPKAPSSLLRHQQCLPTTGGRMGRSRPGRPDRSARITASSGPGRARRLKGPVGRLLGPRAGQTARLTRSPKSEIVFSPRTAARRLP